MKKAWLIAAVIGMASGASQGADVQIFGIHTPNPSGPSHWAVFARISNPQSSIAGAGNVAGISSLSIDVLNNNIAGTGSATVVDGAFTMPFGTTRYSDADQFDPPQVGYGFWLFQGPVTSDSTGMHGISGGQYVNPTLPSSYPVPYRQLVIPGVGLTAGAIAAGANNGDITSATAWDNPVQIATGTYTPSATTGAGSQVGLTMAYSDRTTVDLIRGSAVTDWNLEQAVTTAIVDAKTGNAGTTTVKASPGDANLDGVVDFNDLVKLAQSYNTTGKTWFSGDFTYDGKVDFDDLVQLAQNYNQPVASDVTLGGASFNADLARAFASVPEPRGAILLFGLLGIAIRGRKRKCC
jgi:hypothetical protein